MTDGSSGGGGSGRPGSFGGTSGNSNNNNVPRRMSYASVASGATQQNSSNTSRPGTFAHMATTTPTASYPPAYVPEGRNVRRYSQEQDSSGGGQRTQTQLPAYSRKYQGLPGFGAKVGTPAFFVPSYLRDSRYMSKLEALHTQGRRGQKGTRSGFQLGNSPVDQNSSSVNVQRIAPSHRGMTYELIESNPPKDQDHLMLLPTRWNDQDRYPGLDLSNDGLDVRYNGSTSKSDVEAASVRADYLMPPACGIYYYEVEIKSKNKECAVAVGFSTAKASLERLPGWESESWAYHGDDGKIFCGEHTGKSYNQPFTTGDVIGCGINFNSGHAFFTKNGLYLDVAFREMKNFKVFPCIGIKKYSGAVVSVNFGQRPFHFDIDEKVAQEKASVEAQIKKTKISSLHPKHSETELVQELVLQFLTHGGYVETSKAFDEEVRKEQRSLTNMTNDTPQPISDVDPTNAANRQQIRRAVLGGDIDLAFNITNNHYPEVLQRSPEIVFHLKCRKWVELISKAADLRNRQTSGTADRKARKTSNGSTKPSSLSTSVEDVFDQQMELDDEQASLNDTGKARADVIALNADTNAAYDQLLSQAMEYGQILQREYREETSGDYADTLKNIFSLIVYDEPRESVHGHLLDLNGRVKVAEELNSAILVYLGRPPTAALENAYKQTEALLDILGSDGGSAAFVNLKATF